MKIYYLLGKSCSGKSVLYTKLLADKKLKLTPIITYTTRPIRRGEKDGKEYHFITDSQAEELIASNKVIEKRVYDTEYGKWQYMTVDDGQFIDTNRYIGIGTLESYWNMVLKFGSDVVIPIYLEVSPWTIMSRAMGRLNDDDEKGYLEACRRFIQDTYDYSNENLIKYKIFTRFDNDLGCGRSALTRAKALIGKV